MKFGEAHNCPLCGDRHFVYHTKQEYDDFQEYKHKIMEEYLKEHPGAHRISIDGSLWFQWVDKDGNSIPGPKGGEMRYLKNKICPKEK